MSINPGLLQDSSRKLNSLRAKLAETLQRIHEYLGLNEPVYVLLYFASNVSKYSR